VKDPDEWSPLELSSRIARWTQADLLWNIAPLDPDRATPSNGMHPLYSVAERELPHTTHFAVADADGMVVSCTVTLSSGFGAKILVPGTGIVLNNSVASFSTAGLNTAAPGRRTVSSMAPTLVLHGGRPVLVLGSPGGDTIPSTIVQVLRNVLDRGMALDDAVEAPRLHHGFVPDEVRVEAARPLPDSVLVTLRSMGHVMSNKRIPMGDANTILFVDGQPWGYADSREGGSALAARASGTIGAEMSPAPP
jgi:gamma-glutamyltranspeptidase/glutathione hydrolase